MNQKHLRYIFQWGLVLSVILSACGVSAVMQEPVPLGEIYPLGTGTTSYILSECLRGASESFMYTDGAGKYIFSTLYGTADGVRGVAWVAVDMRARTGLDGIFKVGNATNTVDFQYITSSLKDAGWVKITVAELPAAVISAMKVAGSWLSRMPSMFLIMPGGTLDMLEQGYPQAPKEWQ